MKHVLIDTNVVIHYFLSDPKFFTSASQIFALGINKKVNLYVSSLTFSNAFYVMKKYNAREK